MEKRVTRSIGVRVTSCPFRGTWRFRYSPAAPALARVPVQNPGGHRRGQLAWVPVRSDRQCNRPGSTP